ncbi:uncharacterized protein PRCAT00002460001 [Priceomyces carsonii]|uniref:uncharacterized protein n=1 Tax=Priceomyces carsonii TaxID=28549 RepID=UPI002EDAAAA1|nr:unnamed protein product [Priceomyces carsonii]
MLAKVDEKQYEASEKEAYNEGCLEVVANEDLSSESITSISPNPFSDPKVAKYYEEVYEGCKYECREAFDPLFEWDIQEESKLRKRLDVRVALVSCVMFVALQIDRGNLAQAVSDNMLDDLNLTTADYNLANTVFSVSFLAAELPSQLISKWLGPDRWIPTQMILWSIVATSQAALRGRSSLLVCRSLIGILEGGFIPDLVLWLSYFYTSRELTLRLSWFWTTLSLTQIVTALLAAGILNMRGIAGWAGWQWLFLIEGLITLLIGIASIFLMVPSAAQTKAPWRPNGWFDEREVKIVVNRVLRDDPSKGDMSNRQALTLGMIWKSLSDYDLWPIYIIGFLAYIPTQTANTYLTLTLRLLNYTTFQTNLLTIPPTVIHIITLLLITWLSERLNERSIVSLLVPMVQIPLIAVLRWWKGSMINSWGTWAVCTLFIGLSPYIHAICVSWASRNSNSIRSRSVSAALYNMFVQVGSIVASNIYRPDDAPLYHRGNLNLFILSVAMIPLLIMTKAYYVFANKRRDRKWKEMTVEEREQYVNYSTDQGNKRLDFRFDS